MIVRELVTRLGFSVNDANLKKYERGIGNIKTQADSAANAFRGMFAAFVGFQGLKALANTADEVQSLESRIGQMSQTVGTAGESFDEVSKHATANRMDLKAYATLYTRIGNAAKDIIGTQSDLIGVVDVVSQALVVGGSAASEQASSMLQLSQAFNKGKLDGDEFKSVMENMPVVFTRGVAAAMGFGDNLELFYKASSDGKLTIEGLVAAIKAVGPEISRQFVDMPITIGQSFTIISNRFSTFIARMNRESGAVSIIANSFIWFFNALETGLDKIVDFFGGATQAVKFFGIALAAIAIPFAIQALVGLFALILSPIGLIVGGLILIGLAIEDIYQWATGGKSIMGALFGDFAQYSKPVLQYFANVKANLIAIKDYIANLIDWKPLVSAFKLFIDGAKNVFGGLFNFIKGAFQVLWGILTLDFAMIWSGIKNMFSGLYDIIKGVGQVFVSAIMASVVAIWAALNLAFDGISFSLNAAFGKALAKVKELFSMSFKDIGAMIGNYIYDGIINALAKFAKFHLDMLGIKLPTAVGAGKVANASGAGGGSQQNITVHQTLPPGTPAETALAAKNGIMKAKIWESPMDLMARQAGQAQ